jgi:NAD(P)H-dependent FMN reductase
MSEDHLRLVIVIASIRRGRFGPVPARWLSDEIGRGGRFEVDVIDLAEARLPEVAGDPAPPAVRDLAPWLAAADAFVVVTPEYNGSFPGPLKTAVDWFRDEWRRKPVGFVCYGGPAAGLRAVDHLRQVFIDLDAMTVRDTVTIPRHRSAFDSTGRPVDPRLADVAGRMLEQLAWWAQTLRDGRAVPSGTPRFRELQKGNQ